MNEPHYSDFKRAEAAQARVDAARAEVEDTVDGWTALPGHRAEPHVDFMHPALRDPDNEQNECCGGGCCTPASVEAEHFRHPSSQRFVERVEGWMALHDQKQRDYGSDADPFANVRGGAKKMGLPGWVGAVIRMNDKMERLNKAAKQWIETGQISLANEGVLDSFDDMGVYSGIGATLFEEES